MAATTDDPTAQVEDLGRWSWWRAQPASRPDRPLGFEALVLIVLVVWNVAAHLWVPDVLEVPASLVGLTVLLVVARRAGLSGDQLALSPDGVGSGIRVGVVAAAVIVGAIVVLAAIPFSRELFADARFADMGVAELLYDALVRIPMATALAEEIAFRGVVLGMLLLWMSPLRATLLASVLFGLWHIFPGIAALDTAAVDVGENDVVEAGAVAGQVVVTTLAGIGLCWLRFRGRHILSPTLAHWALNGGALVAGWLVLQNGWA